MCLKPTGWVANSIDPYQTPRSLAFDQGVQFAHVDCPNAEGIYGNILTAITLMCP